MRYIGNKTKLLKFIEQIIEKHNIRGTSFTDLFAGAGSVGDYFKTKYSINSNDFMYYAYIFNCAKLLNESQPRFEKFVLKYNQEIFEWLNNKQYKSNKHFFIYNNYTPQGGRMFFTEENGLKIDGTRITIEELYRDQIISDNEYFFLLASLLESVTKVSNTSGTYEAFFKFWESRAIKGFKLEPLEFVQSKINGINTVFNSDSNSLIREISGDILYIDPPYSVTQYASAYHLLETIARYDFPLIKGVGGKRDKGTNVSLYSRKQFAKEKFEDLFRQSNFTHILISYSNQSIVPLDELIALATNFAIDGKVYVENVEYREYQNHRSSNKRNGSNLEEVVVYFQKDRTYAKSPLNYSGSKDTLLPEITRELPEHVGTFVDAMGGAFNVGANIRATDEVIYNENNNSIFEIIKWLLKSDKSEIINETEQLIAKYNLTKRGKESYLNLRQYYNEREYSALSLFVLHMYAFQNMIRFNGDLKFNTPIGVAGYSDDIKNRIINFKTKTGNFKLLNQSYTELKWENYPIDTLFYFDPPYFITSAAYNDGKRGMKGWDGDAEIELLSILTKIDKLGYNFLLSNVLHHRGKTNHLLIEWVQEHDFKVVSVGKSGWRYQKDEVLIKNY